MLLSPKLWPKRAYVACILEDTCQVATPYFSAVPSRSNWLLRSRFQELCDVPSQQVNVNQDSTTCQQPLWSYAILAAGARGTWEKWGFGWDISTKIAWKFRSLCQNMMMALCIHCLWNTLKYSIYTWSSGLITKSWQLKMENNEKNNILKQWTNVKLREHHWKPLRFEDAAWCYLCWFSWCSQGLALILATMLPFFCCASMRQPDSSSISDMNLSSQFPDQTLILSYWSCCLLCFLCAKFHGWRVEGWNV